MIRTVRKNLTLDSPASRKWCVIGISVNTQHMTADDAADYLARVEAEMGLPTVDPFRNGAGRLVDALAALG